MRRAEGHVNQENNIDICRTAGIARDFPAQQDCILVVGNSCAILRG
jgi:hypothetical protein